MDSYRVIIILEILLHIIGAYATLLLIDDSDSQVNSRAICKQKGMDLASVPKTEQQTNDVQNYLSTSFYWVWIGLYWNKEALAFYWSDTNRIVNNANSLPWIQNHPRCMTGHTDNCLIKRDCVIITESGLETYLCDFSHQALCEKVSLTKDTTGVNNVISTSLTTAIIKSVADTRALTTSTMKVGHATTALTFNTTQTTSDSDAGLSLLVVPSNKDNTCMCPCDSVGSIWLERLEVNITTEEIRTLALKRVEQIISDIAIDKTNTSAYIRRHTSAMDYRESSARLGLVGIIVLVIPVLFIVGIDCINFYQRSSI